MNKIKCYICDKKISSNVWSHHWKWNHKEIDKIKFRDKFFNIKPKICKNPSCNNITSYSCGKYNNHCCIKCVNQDPNHINKVKQTKKRRYDNPTYNNSDQTKKTKLKLYNDETFVNTDKAKRTKQKRYDDPTYNNRPKAEKTCLFRYDVKNPSQIKLVKDKKEKTCLHNFGVKYPMQSEIIMNKSIKSYQYRYGANHYTKSLSYKIRIPEILAKANRTKKRNGSYGKSKKEDAFHEFFKSNFDESVERQAMFNQWAIDFYSPKYDMFIQFDGDY